MDFLLPPNVAHSCNLCKLTILIIFGKESNQIMKFIFTDDSILLKYNAVSKGNQFPVFWRHIAGSSSMVERSKNLIWTVLLLCPVPQVQIFFSILWIYAFPLWWHTEFHNHTTEQLQIYILNSRLLVRHWKIKYSELKGSKHSWNWMCL